MTRNHGDLSAHNEAERDARSDYMQSLGHGTHDAEEDRAREDAKRLADKYKGTDSSSDPYRGW